MLLGEFRDLLAEADPSWPVLFDSGSPVGRVVSWRGVYAEASLDTGDEPRAAGDLLAEVERVLAGEKRQGWKGGDYSYYRTTPLWADPDGEWNGRIPVGLRTDLPRQVVVTTALVPDEYR